MAWLETDVMKQRSLFVLDFESGLFSMSDVWTADFKGEFLTRDQRTIASRPGHTPSASPRSATRATSRPQGLCQWVPQVA